MKRNNLNPLYLLIIVSLHIYNGEAAECFALFGPSGAKKCVLDTSYNGYQWVTCHRDTYVEKTTNNRYSCLNPFHYYCLFPCMLEVYGNPSGSVKGICKCSPGDPEPSGFFKTTTTQSPEVRTTTPRTTTPRTTTPRTTTPRTTTPRTTTPRTTTSIIPSPLPRSCYNENDTECKWYKECLNNAFPACETENEYSINFAETFCKLSDENLKGFSTQGKQWLNAARVCLKSKLLPFIKGGTRAQSCTHLRSEAIDRYTLCHLNPGPSSPSYCSLPVKDRLIEFWHIRLNTDYDATYEPALKDILDMMSRCRDIPQENSLVKAAKDKIDKNSRNRAREIELRMKYWLENPPTLPIQLDMFLKDVNWQFLKDANAEAKSQFAAKVVDAVAINQEWITKGVTMFAYVVKNGNTMSIRLLMDDRYKYIKNVSTRQADLNGALVQLTREVINGTLNFQIELNGVQIVKLNGCLDWNCKEHAFSVQTSASHRDSNGASHGATYTLLCLAISLISIFLS